MLSTEKAFKMLPFVVDIYEKINLENYLLKFATTAPKGISPEKLEKLQNKKGLELITYVIKNASKKASTEVFEVVAIFQEATVEEIKNQSFSKTKKSLQEIVADSELMSFFEEAM